jgi:hypothetical protein
MNHTIYDSMYHTKYQNIIMNTNSSSTNNTNYFQIILSHVPHINGSRKSYTFSKNTRKSYIDYYDLFKFIEKKSGIPRRYFIISQGKKRTKFTSLIHNITPHSIQYIPKQPVDILDVSINVYTDTSMFYKHKKLIQTASNTNNGTLINTIKAICNYINILHRKHPIILDYFDLLTIYCCSDVITELSNSYNPPLFT